MSKNQKKENGLLKKEDSKDTSKSQTLVYKEESTNNEQSKNLKFFDNTDNNNNSNSNLIMNGTKIGKEHKKVEKNVVISNKVQVIQVENWKEYNLLQNVEPNLYFMNQNENKEENDENRKKKQKDDIKCCLIN